MGWAPADRGRPDLTDAGTAPRGVQRGRLDRTGTAGVCPEDRDGMEEAQGPARAPLRRLGGPPEDPLELRPPDRPGTPGAVDPVFNSSDRRPALLGRGGTSGREGQGPAAPGLDDREERRGAAAQEPRRERPAARRTDAHPLW